MKYFNEAYKIIKVVEFTNLTEGGMSMSDYIKKFEELSCFAPYMVSTIC